MRVEIPRIAISGLMIYCLMKRLYISEYFVSSFAPIIELVYCTQTSKMSEQEFTVRIPPRNEKKNYHIMKFNANLKVDVGKWNQVSITKTYLKSPSRPF